ncbi:hypothetical protein B0T16DRAFT_176796 [Cercophora newfieldiana]|uniref:Myb-like domain-containing protein n=1 Tax=Cercophora newfieldiana TaxID=92897 RepID=A0AA40CMQ5_9PEZI|nr:hypothetical protein B0T16DRAFT_176796 [Cercophora newfieldiana]
MLWQINELPPSPPAPTMTAEKKKSGSSGGAKSSKYSKPWTHEQDDIFKVLGMDVTWATIAKVAGHSVNECKLRYAELLQASAAPASRATPPTPTKSTKPVAETKPAPSWNPAQDSFILANAGKASWDEIGAVMGHSAAAVSDRWIALQARLQRPPPQPVPFVLPAAPQHNGVADQHHGVAYQGHGTYGFVQPAAPPAQPQAPTITAMPWNSGPVPPGSVLIAVPAQAQAQAQAPIPMYAYPAHTTAQAPAQAPAPAATTASSSAPAPTTTPAVPLAHREFPGRPPPGVDPAVFRREDAIAFFHYCNAMDRVVLPPRRLRPDKLWDEHDCRVLELVASRWKGDYRKAGISLYNFTDKWYTEQQMREKLRELWGPTWDLQEGERA